MYKSRDTRYTASMNVTTESLLKPLGFVLETLPARGKGKPMRAYVFRFPGSKRGAHAVVLAAGYNDVTEDPDQPVALWLKDGEGREVHQPVYCCCVEEVAQQFRDGVWDGFWDSTLSLNPRR